MATIDETIEQISKSVRLSEGASSVARKALFVYSLRLANINLRKPRGSTKAAVSIRGRNFSADPRDYGQLANPAENILRPHHVDRILQAQAFQRRLVPNVSGLPALNTGQLRQLLDDEPGLRELVGPETQVLGCMDVD